METLRVWRKLIWKPLESRIKDQDQGPGSRIRIKDQDQGSGSWFRIKGSIKGSDSRVRIKDLDQTSLPVAF